ncbi:MAG: hypothetical protein JW963_04590 [Anaerolineales bacterium]|nr:hypothetical protein [Anaerolineales bacterium]
MPEMPEGTKPPTPEEILAGIHASLKSQTVQTRLDAIQKLVEQKFSSPAILRLLEDMALKDRSKPVREAALKVLDTPTHRYIQGRTAKLNRKERQTVLTELANWETEGLIPTYQADVIRQRYNFDLKPAPPHSVSPPPPTQPKPATSKESLSNLQPAPPRASLTQTLLSEISIKIALYLGAFFVIAAAAILAAVVEAARLPILLAATALFAGGALITRARLPQPSFALFIVFSFLLPTDANVLADVINLSGSANAGYWFVAMVIMAIIWGFGTWFYASRLFSLAAFTALVISVIRLGELFEAGLEIYLLLLSLVTFLGLGSVYLLKRWRSTKFSLPLFILVQTSQLGLIAFALVAIAIRLDDLPSAWNLLSTLFWLLTMSFYVLSDLIFPFVLFPWLSSAALYPVPLNFMIAFDVEALPIALATWGWGFTLALTSEILRRLQIDKIRRYAMPALAGSLLVILTAVFIGYIDEIPYGFAFILASAILYTLLHILKPRAYVWATALVLGLGAYFSFFALPFMENFEIFAGYQLLGASLLLLLPDLFLKPDLSAEKTWRWPMRIIGAILAFFNMSLILSSSTDNTGRATIAYGIYTVFFALYALKFDKAWLGYIAISSAALAVTFALQHFELDAWLPALTALSAFYYLAGSILGRNEKRTPWSNMLRYSGLGLASLVSLLAIVSIKESSGWYILATALVFGIEMFTRHAGLAEAGAQLFFASGVFMLLQEAGLKQGYQWLGVALALLGTDLLLARSYADKRLIAWFSRGFGALVVAANTLDLLFNNFDPQVGATCFAIYTLFFLAQTLLYHLPSLGYSFTVYSLLTIIFTLQTFNQPKWMLPATLLAIIYYAVGYFLRKRKLTIFETNEETKNDEFAFTWPFVLWTSGLGVVLLAAIVALVQGGLSATIPAAVTATMVAVEAFDRRNVWLGFPANTLYLISYFILLVELNVDEPQFFSIATAALGMLMHYLLTRAGSRTGAFITGMVSQLVLLSTTYIQFLSTERLNFFAIIFFQALVVLIYGIVIRSRSLVITPIIFLVLSVITVLYGLLEGILPVILIGCTGLILLMLGILAVIMRERLKQISERFGDWGA